MKFKKIVSAIAALAMSVSMFAGLAITADAVINSEETEEKNSWGVKQIASDRVWCTNESIAATETEEAYTQITVRSATKSKSQGIYNGSSYISNKQHGGGGSVQSQTSGVKIIEQSLRFHYNSTKVSVYYGDYYKSAADYRGFSKLASLVYTVSGATEDSTGSLLVTAGSTTQTVSITEGQWYDIACVATYSETGTNVDVYINDGTSTTKVSGTTTATTALNNIGITSDVVVSDTTGIVDSKNESIYAVAASDSNVVSVSGATTLTKEQNDQIEETYVIEVLHNTTDNLDISGDIANTVWAVTDTDGNTVEGATITDGVLTIDPTFPVGTTTLIVTATRGTTASDSVEVSVTNTASAYTPVLTAVSITGDDYTGYAEFEDSITYTAMITDQNGAEMPLEEISWSISPADDGITFDNGVVTISHTASAGTYTVTASSVTDPTFSASKTITLSRVRDIEYQGVDVITPFDGYARNAAEVYITKQQNTGETLRFEFDIYVPANTTSSFTYKSSNNIGAEYRFAAGDEWVIMQYVTGGSGAYNMNSSDAYCKFKADHWVHVIIETPVTGNPGLGNSIFTATTVDSSDTSAFDQGDRVRYPSNTSDGGREIGARNLGSRALKNIYYSGNAYVTNIAMYTVAANVTIDATNATVSGIEAGYIAQNTYTATVTADEGYTVSAVTVDGEAVTANEDGTYSIVVDGDTAVAVATEAIPTSAITVTAPNATVLGFTSDTVYYGTYTATITAALGYELGTVTVNGIPVEVADDGTCQIEVNSAETAIVVTTTAKTDTWVFEKIDLNDWATANIFFEYATPDVEGTTVVPSEVNAITITNFLATYADKTLPEVTGDGEINFAITVLQDGENGEYLTDMWLKKAEGVVVLSTGAFDADAEMEESDYIELGTGEFDVE